MRLTAFARLAFTATLDAARGTHSKTDFVLVRCHSVVTGYQVNKIRPRLGDKAEFVSWDPLIQQEVLYKEEKKIKSVKPSTKGTYKGTMNYPCMMHNHSDDPDKRCERNYHYIPRNYWFDYNTLKAKKEPKDWAALRRKYKRTDFNYSVFLK